MTHQSRENYEPLIDPLDEIEKEDSRLLIPTAHYRNAKLGKQLLAHYTGSPDTFLDKEREDKLATNIHNGMSAQQLMDSLSEKERMSYPEQTARVEEAINIGKESERELLEANLGFAAYYALASMGYLQLDTGDNNENTPNNGTTTGTRPPQIGAFSDITKLRSRYGSLEDRVQFANLGLLDAVRKFKPNNPTKANFIGFAKWRIHGHISRGVGETETAGVRLPVDVREKIHHARLATKDEAPDDQDTIDNLNFIHDLTESVSFETLPSPARAYEEYENEYDGVPSLSLADVIADPNESNDPLDELRIEQTSKAIQEVLDTLSSQEASIIRLRFGLVDGRPRTLDEIGAVYNLSRERIRQIESKTMTKLRHPQRSTLLLSHLKNMSASYTDQVTQLPLSLADRVHGVVNLHHPEALASYKRFRRPLFSAKDPLEDRRDALLDSWQISRDEDWDTPVYTPPVERPHDAESEAVLLQRFKTIMNNLDPDDFELNTEDPFPTESFEAVMEKCGDKLLAHHIEEFWNTHIEQFVQNMEKIKGDSLSFDAISLFFSYLLKEVMRDEDTIELIIPEQLNKKLNYFGSHLERGVLIVRGDLGDYAGSRMRQFANLDIRGSVGNYAGAYSQDNASLKIQLDAGEQFAHGASDETTFDVGGSIESLGIPHNFTGEIRAREISWHTLSLAKYRQHIVYR